MAELSEKELNLLAYTLLGEAAGEGREGMEAVMWTIRNRAEDPRFPDNPANVATQANSKGVYQYSTWNKKGDGGNKPKTRFSTNSPEFKEALQVVQRVMAGEVEDPTGGATHYYAEGSQKPAWFEAEGPAGEVKIGNHRFAARNTEVDAATNAADAATIMGSGRLRVRPASAYAPVPEQTPQGGLTSRSVKTIDIDEQSLNAPAYPSQSPSVLQSSLDRVAQQKATQLAANREAARLRELRVQQQNQNDLRGEAAKAVATNAASADKQERRRAVDQTGAAARVSTVNAASAAKTDRAAQPAAPVPQSTIERAPAKPAATKSSGVTKTAGTVLSDGTKLALAGETQLPRDVTPQVTVPKPAPVTKFIKPQQVTPAQVRAATGFVLPVTAQTPKVNTFIAPPHDDSKRLPQGKTLELRTSAQQNINVERAEQAIRRKGTIAKKPTTIQPPEPTIEQVVAVRDVARPRGPVTRRTPVGPVVLANGQIAAQPQVRPVAVAIAQGASALTGAAGTPGLTQSTESQESKFQWTDNTYLPDRIANDPRWW